MSRNEAVAAWRLHRAVYRRAVRSWGGQPGCFTAAVTEHARCFGRTLATPAQWVAVAEDLSEAAHDRAADLGSDIPCRP